VLLRILILVLVLWLALEVGFRLLRRLLRSGVRKAMENAARAQGRPRGSRTDQGPAKIEAELVRCDRCGVRIPRDRALKGAGGVLYCSPSCADGHG
jgi:hypothetical protein